jgi:trans-2,3-dihydro-3-hydroxyanthranilate isomerase
MKTKPPMSRSRSAYSPDSIHVWQVDAFTAVPLAGNPAGVVLDARGLSDPQMQSIARELACSETAFLFPSSTDRADYSIRWFTPQCEVRICGHATLAAFTVLAERGRHGMKNIGNHRFTVQTLSGLLPVTVERRARALEVTFGLPLPVFRNMPAYEKDLLPLLKIGSGDRDRRFDIVSDGEHIYAALCQRDVVQKLSPEMTTLSAYLDATGHTGLCIFTTETLDRSSHVHSRLFAPNVGIPEDPVTGSANGPLGVLLAKLTGVHKGRSSLTFIGEQGDEVGRPGRVTIRVVRKGGEPVSVSVGGTSIIVMHADMRLNKGRKRL